MIFRMSDFDNDLLNEFQRLDHGFDHLFGRWPWPTNIRSGVPRAFPPVNVGATPERVDVYAFVAGLDPQSLDISIQQNVLTIAGKRDSGADQERTSARHLKERFSGDFRRVLTLPDDIDPDRVTASYSNGVVNIIIQRREVAKRQKIEIK